MIVIDTLAVADSGVGSDWSLALTVNVVVPVVVGVPEIVPAELSVNPEGSVPAASDQL